MRTLRSFLVGALVAAAFAAAFVAFASADGYDPYRAVCHLRVGGVQGSGTLIAGGDSALVLSCRHVCQAPGLPVTVSWPAAGGQTTQGRVLEIVPGANFDTDLALVQCGVPTGVKPRTMARRQADGQLRDSPFVAVGYRDGWMRTVCTNTAVRSGSLVGIPHPLVPGQSGGPLYDRFGNVVAVVVASDFRSVGVACDGLPLFNLIKKYRRR